MRTVYRLHNGIHALGLIIGAEPVRYSGFRHAVGNYECKNSVVYRTARRIDSIACILIPKRKERGTLKEKRGTLKYRIVNVTLYGL